MKKIIAIAVLAGIIIALVAGFIGWNVGVKTAPKSFFTQREMSDEKNLYSIPAEVTEIHREKDLIFFVDMRGEEYAFVSDLAWEVGDEITVIFDSRGTGDLTDDIVINVNWLGEWEG